MDIVDKVRLLADLTESHCELNHGPGSNPDDFPAVNYLITPIGTRRDEVREIAVRELIIPICEECVEAINADEWTLLYCFQCSANRWICRRMAKNSYRHHILWLRGCPDCSNEFGGLYFTDAAGLVPNAGLAATAYLKEEATVS